MKFYIDSDCCCHPENTAGTFRQMEHSFFDGKCSDFIKGYRFVPSGESWTRSDGVTFHGEMIAPWKPSDELDAAQREYERVKLAQYEAQQNELITSYNEGVNSI